MRRYLTLCWEWKPSRNDDISIIVCGHAGEYRHTRSKKPGTRHSRSVPGQTTATQPSRGPPPPGSSQGHPLKNGLRLTPLTCTIA